MCVRECMCEYVSEVGRGEGGAQQAPRADQDIYSASHRIFGPKHKVRINQAGPKDDDDDDDD